MGKLGTGAQSEWKMVKLTKIDQLFCHSPKIFLGNKHDKGKRTLVIFLAVSCEGHILSEYRYVYKSR